MAQPFSRQASQVVQNTYDKSRDLMDTVAEQSNQLYDDLRRWVPKHQTAVRVSAATAVGLGIVGYMMGRKRARASAKQQARAMWQSVRMPDLGMAPFFKFMSLWMLYRVATRE